MTQLVLEHELEMFTSTTNRMLDSTFDQIKEFTFRGLKGVELSKEIFCNDEFCFAYNAHYNELKQQWHNDLKDGHTYLLINPKRNCYMIHPSTRIVDSVQLTSFSLNGLPQSHSTYDNMSKLIEENAHILILSLFKIEKVK